MMVAEHPCKQPLQSHESTFAATRDQFGERLRRVELELRVYRLVLFTACTVVVITIVGGAAGRQDTPEEVRAQRFSVVDQQGRIKAYFGHSGTSTSLQIGADGQGIRMEHGAHTNALQLITPAYTEKKVEGFQSNSLTLHNDPYNSGVLIINPGTREDENSRGRVWLSTLKGYELSREMF